MVTRTNLIRIGFAAGALALIVAGGFGLASQRSAAEDSTTQAARYAPPPPLPSEIEMAKLRAGMAAADAHDWIGLALQRDGAEDDIVRKLLQWRYAIETNAPMDFDALRSALNNLPGWPGRRNMRIKAEQAIFSSGLSSSERVGFLRQEGGPLSGDGRIALAVALKNEGQRSEANEIARAAWREDSLGDAAEAAAVSNFSGAFSQDDYTKRVDILIWRGQRSEAQRLFPHIAAADRLLGTARIALQVRQRRGLQRAVDAVPASRRDDAGLLYDRARYIRRSGRPEDAMPIAARIDPTQAPYAARDEIFDERRLYVARALRNGQARTAYALVANHGLNSGEDFADAEWTAGWLALRHLNDPALAAQHFAHLDAIVSAPVSASRAAYWRAQAALAQGQSDEGNTQLARAAQFKFTYYGQLAAEQIGDAVMNLQANDQVSEESRTKFYNRELVKALRAMSQVGDQGDFERIAFYLDDTLDDADEYELLSRMARELGFTKSAVRSAKAGLFRGVVAPVAAYPLIDMPERVRMRGTPEPALILSVIRQESEFAHDPVSHANARGMMQLLPATARLVAAREGLPYERTRLITDPDYNITLGSAYLQQLIDQFNGSYVLALAAYNAGPNRASEWIGDWGDPRSPSTDVVDWVEHIPFGETKNYVQRIMENVQVYRFRLAGTPTQISLTRDLRRGG